MFAHPIATVHRRIALLIALVLAVGGIALFAPVAPAHAANIIVTSNADNVIPPPNSLREAVANANPGDVITFDPSVTSIDLVATLVLPEGITIEGPGGTTLAISRANAANYVLFLITPDDGDAVVDLDQDYVFRGFRISGVTGTGQAIYSTYGPNNDRARNVTLDDMTIEYMTASYGAAYGSFQQAGSLTVTNSTFTGNTATVDDGGAISADSIHGAVSISGSHFVDNDATTYGGAVSVDDLTLLVPVIISTTNFDDSEADHGGALAVTGSASVAVTDSFFRNNHATDGDGGGADLNDVAGTITFDGVEAGTNTASNNGGAFNLDADGLVTITDSRISSNTATYGGGVWFQSAGWNVGLSLFSFNEATQSGGAIYGSGVYADSNITDSTFSANEALTGGAASTLVDNSSTLTIARSVFAGNSFTSSGGALYLSPIAGASNVLVDSSTFSGQVYAGNGAPTGWSIRVASLNGVVDVVNSTLDETVGANGAAFSVGTIGTGNIGIQSSTIRGPGGVFVENQGASDSSIENTILEATGAGNALTSDFSGGGRILVSWSVLGTGMTSLATDVTGNQLNTDPQLGSLANDGGPTATRLPLAGSPAINMGDPTFVAPPALDQRGAGFPRVQGARIDIGAVEVQAPELAETGGTVSWWLLFVAGGVMALGVAALVLTRRRKPARH